MIYLLGTYEHALVAFIGVLFAFAATCIAIAKLKRNKPLTSTDIAMLEEVHGKTVCT